MKAKRPKWNWMGSPILSNAVAKGIISETEAEVVIENACYKRSYNTIVKGLHIRKKTAKRLYRNAIPKLRKWIITSVIIMPKGKAIFD